ncbi:preprotein translocase subunit SecE [bacterium]|nr:preprotein translocase subunit SecE [bacterium]
MANETTTNPNPSAGPSPTDLQERRLFNFYRPEEGHRSRALLGLSLGTLLLFGAYSFYEWLPIDWRTPLPKVGLLLGEEFAISGALVSSVILGLAFLAGIYWLVNYPKFVDFLIETENEMKKVSWASRKQVMTESLVVIVTVIILMIYIFLVDQLLIFVKLYPDWDRFWDKMGLG